MDRFILTIVYLTTLIAAAGNAQGRITTLSLNEANRRARRGKAALRAAQLKISGHALYQLEVDVGGSLIKYQII